MLDVTFAARHICIFTRLIGLRVYKLRCELSFFYAGVVKTRASVYSSLIQLVYIYWILRNGGRDELPLIFSITMHPSKFSSTRSSLAPHSRDIGSGAGRGYNPFGQGVRCGALRQKLVERVVSRGAFQQRVIDDTSRRPRAPVHAVICLRSAHTLSQTRNTRRDSSLGYWHQCWIRDATPVSVRLSTNLFAQRCL